MRRPAAGILRSGSARLGRFQKDDLPSRSRAFHGCGSRPSTRAKGAAWSLPLSIESEMDAKTHHLVLLAALSLSCAGLALAMDDAIFGSVFSALSAVAVLGAAGPKPRR